MRLFKQKTGKKATFRLALSAVLAAILWCFATPIMAEAAGFERLAFLPVFGQVVAFKNAFLDKAGFGEFSTLPKSNERKPDKVVKAVITAYTSTADQTDDTPFIAASGKRVYDGMLAANWLPFGTKIKIPSLYGDKIFTVDDRMNSRYGYGRMDIWLDTTKAEARKFGVQRVEIEVYYK